VTPDVTVIVPVRDGERELPGLMETLAAQTLARERFELIVVDNASRDSTATVARAAGATVVSEPVPNRARARNRGAGAANAALLAFTDVDCRPDAGWLEALVGCAGVAPLVAGPVEVSTSAAPNSIERFEKLWRFSQEAWVKLGWAATANLMVHRDAFEAVGGLDPAYRRIAEDADFCIRAGRAGHALGYCPDALVRHAAESRMRPFLRRAFNHGYSSSQALRRIGVGHEAWREPGRLVRGNGAMRQLGLDRDMFEEGEWRRMQRLARLAYGARMAGSVWATMLRAR
jgi:GT2 family glycosyltransferase